MFRKLYNQALIEGEIEPDGPILIVQGGLPLDPLAAALSFVRTFRNGSSTVYLPGSSLKGVIRAQAERILATEIGPEAAEDPFDQQTKRRKEAEAAKKTQDTSRVYAVSCAADRLFGSTVIAGRFVVRDAYPTSETLDAANRTEIRYSVAIDRAKQSVQHGPFDQEAVTGGRFTFHATLENFELWMLALILQVLRDIDQGFVQVGHAKTRGYGTVHLLSPVLHLRWPGQRPKKLRGVGGQESSEELRDAYGLSSDDETDLPPGATEEESGLFLGYRFEGWDALVAVLGSLAQGPWRSFVQQAQKGG